MNHAPPSDPLWTEFQARHPGNPHLRSEPLYSLSPCLIRLITERVPGLLKPGDVEFENDLWEYGRGGGFSARTGFADPLQLEPHELSSAARPTTPPRETEPDRRARELFNPHSFWPRGLSDEGEEGRTARLRWQRAYAVWLMCDPLFRKELRHLKVEEGALVTDGHFPREPDAQDAARTDSTGPPWGPYFYLYRKWGLRTLCTWELPLPLAVERRDAGNQVTVNHPGAGVVLFVPWHRLRQRKLDLHELIGPALTSPDLKHLSGWLEAKPDDAADRLGWKRREDAFFYYRYWTLALAPRYQARMRGRTERIDKVFAALRDVDDEVEAETIRKVRLRLVKDLAAAGDVSGTSRDRS